MGGALAARGYRPTDILVVQRKLGPAESVLPGVNGPMSIVPQPASTTYSNSAGEQIFWSWDDGDDSTWEGSQYVERYSDGAWASYDVPAGVSLRDPVIQPATGPAALACPSPVPSTTTSADLQTVRKERRR